MGTGWKKDTAEQQQDMAKRTVETAERTGIGEMEGGTWMAQEQRVDTARRRLGRGQRQEGKGQDIHKVAVKRYQKGAKRWMVQSKKWKDLSLMEEHQ